MAKKFIIANETVFDGVNNLRKFFGFNFQKHRPQPSFRLKNHFMCTIAVDPTSSAPWKNEINDDFSVIKYVYQPKDEDKKKISKEKILNATIKDIAKHISDPYLRFALIFETIHVAGLTRNQYKFKGIYEFDNFNSIKEQKVIYRKVASDFNF